jgi:hypothetical protein
MIDFMTIESRDIKPARSEAKDEGESLGLMEPILTSDSSGKRGPLTDLALEAPRKSARLRSSLPPGVAHAQADPVRAVNCDYRNLIEGRDAHPINIERALLCNDRRQAPLRLALPAALATRWMPGLFPDKRQND